MARAPQAVSGGVADRPVPVPGDLVGFCRIEHPRLVGTLGLVVGDVELAQDLAQEVLLRVCREWERIQGLESPGGWAHRVGINLARSALRSRSLHREIEDRLGASLENTTPASDVPDAISVRAAVSALPERQRIALVLRYYADLSVETVASIMECPTATVKTLTRRALIGLRASGLEAAE